MAAVISQPDSGALKRISASSSRSSMAICLLAGLAVGASAIVALVVLTSLIGGSVNLLWTPAQSWWASVSPQESTPAPVAAILAQITSQSRGVPTIVLDSERGMALDGAPTMTGTAQ